MPSALTVRERRALRAAITEELVVLDAQVVALTRAFDDIVDAAVQSNVDDEHDPEGTTIAFERAQVAALLRQARLDQAVLRETLERVDGSGFGTCTECGAFIGVERLLALPGAARCMRCAT